MFSRSGGGAMRLKRGRVTQTPSPTPSPVTMSRYRGRVGDSQTDGREGASTNAKSPIEAFEKVWTDSGYLAALSLQKHGQSGRSLQGSLDQADGFTYAGTPWVHIQESGNQNLAGQATAAAFGTTFYNGMVAINTEWPGAQLSYETAYSFSDARKAEAFRNWDTYNTELRAQVAALAGVGITVRIVETEYYILQAVAALGYDTICYPDTHANAYHYQGIGNFCVALAMYKAFNFNISALTHSGINLDAGQKATIVSIVSGS